MIKKTTLQLLDQVNVRFRDLDPFIRRQIVEKLKFFVPYARHMPAFKLGRWDGKVAFATAGGATFLNLLDRVLPLVIEAGYEIDIEDHRPKTNFNFEQIDENFLADRVWPKGHPMEGEPIMLRDYQVQAINTFFNPDNYQSIQELSTGAGKTIMSAALSLACEKYGKTIVIVPSKSLVVQTEADYINCGLDVGVYFGERKDIDKTHTIATWQSLEAWAKATRQGDAEVPINDFLDNVVCVITDEVHSAKANVLRDLLSGPLAKIPLRFGITGTVPREEYEFLSLLSTIGPVVGGIKAVELQERGVLASSHINIIQTIDDHLEFTDYHAELDWLTSDTRRLEWIADFVQTLSPSGNTLILVNKIECGKALAELIPGAKFISGATKMSARSEEYSDFGDKDDKVLIATYGIASTGISITRIHNLVLLEAGKAFTRTIQSIGRGLRKGFDKVNVDVYDICSTMKFSKRHLAKRKAYYADAEYKNTTTKVNYR